MRNKSRSSNTFPPPLPSSQAELLSSTSFPRAMQGEGNGGYGQFITRCLCRSFLLRGRTPHTLPLLQREGTSHRRQFSTKFSNVSPCHGLQLFMNRPSVGPSHRVQSFRSKLLQRGSPTGSQALPANLLRRGLLSPRVRRSWQEPAPLRAPHGVTASFRHHLLQRGVPSMGCRWGSAPLWTSMGCKGTACLIMVFCMGCRGISAPAPGAPPPPPSSLTWVSAELFLSHALTPLFWLLLHSHFYPL